MKTYNLILFALLAVFLLGACLSKECRENSPKGGNYQFVIPATLSPAKDTFRIGDTIMITSVFDDMVYERVTQDYYQLIDWELLFDIHIYNLNIAQDRLAADAIVDFDTLVVRGHNNGFFPSFTGHIGFLANHEYQDGEYALIYGMVPRKAGLYFLLHNGINRSEQPFSGRCAGRGYDSDVKVELNGGIDNNVDFLLEGDSAYQAFLNNPQAQFHDWGGYCFYVVE